MWRGPVWRGPIKWRADGRSVRRCARPLHSGILARHDIGRQYWGRSLGDLVLGALPRQIHTLASSHRELMSSKLLFFGIMMFLHYLHISHDLLSIFGSFSLFLTARLFTRVGKHLSSCARCPSRSSAPSSKGVIRSRRIRRAACISSR